MNSQGTAGPLGGSLSHCRLYCGGRWSHSCLWRGWAASWGWASCSPGSAGAARGQRRGGTPVAQAPRPSSPGTERSLPRDWRRRGVRAPHGERAAPPRQRPGSHCERACGVGSPCCLRSVGAPGTVDPRTRPADGEMEAHGAQLVGAEPGPPDPVAACFSPLQMARWRSPSPSPGEGDTPAVRPWAGIRAGQACRGAPRGSERPVRLCGLCTAEFAPRFVPNPGPWCRPQRAHREDRDARVCPWVVTLSCPLGWLGHPLWLRRDLGEKWKKILGSQAMRSRQPRPGGFRGMGWLCK